MNHGFIIRFVYNNFFLFLNIFEKDIKIFYSSDMMIEEVKEQFDHSFGIIFYAQRQNSSISTTKLSKIEFWFYDADFWGNGLCMKRHCYNESSPDDHLEVHIYFMYYITFVSDHNFLRAFG